MEKWNSCHVADGLGFHDDDEYLYCSLNCIYYGTMDGLATFYIVFLK